MDFDASEALLPEQRRLHERRSHRRNPAVPTPAAAPTKHHDSDASYTSSDDDIAEILSFWDKRPTSGQPSWKPLSDINANLCHRCHKKVYPVERIDVGVLYHRGCFKCHSCGLQLTLKNFHREFDPKSLQTVKDVYCKNHVPKVGQAIIDEQSLEIKNALEAQKKASAKGKGTELEAGWSYTPENGAPRSRTSASAQQKNSLKKRSSLRSFKDFERFGIFEAQAALETLHRKEEDELYRQIFDERLAHVRRLEKAMISEKEKSVKQLIAWFEEQKAKPEDREAGLKKVEQYFRKKHADQMKKLLQRLADEEQAAVTRMVDKHSQEMLSLIQEKAASPPPPKRKERQIDAGILRERSAEVRRPSTPDSLPDDTAPLPEELNSYLAAAGLVPARSPSPSPRSRLDSSPTARTSLLRRDSRGSGEPSPPPTASGQFSAFEDNARAASPGQTAGHVDLDDTYLEAIPPFPDVVPPESSKNSLYEDPDVFKDFDSQAIEESKKEHQTFTDLVKKLSWRCETQLQKARAIFRWITVKDLNKIDFEEAIDDEDSPLGLLRGIKYGTETYHNLFKRLSSYAGLHCEVIEGFSKGSGYRPGSRIAGSTFRNQWTAVWIDGSWRFINCNWGARHVKGPRAGHMTYKCDEFYFLTDPQEHIYQHFPDDPAWQLLKKPLSHDEFVALPVVKSPFFNNKLRFMTNYNALLDAPDGMVEVRLVSRKLYGYAAKLKSKNRARDVPPEMMENRTLIRQVDDEVAVTVNLPSPGNYYLDIYMSGDWHQSSMDCACSFQIRCSSVSRDAHATFPQVGVFGRTPHFDKFKMSVEKYHDPYLIYKGEMELNFFMKKEVKLSHSLRRWDHRDRVLGEYDRYALLRYRTDKAANFVIRCPRRGLYVFSVYGLAESGEDLKCLFRYLLDCKAPVLDARPMPKASKRWRHCRLIEPLVDELPLDNQIRFQVESSAATEMSVLIKDKWYNLKSTDNVWQGQVNTGKTVCKAVLYGRFDAKAEKFVPLMEFHLREMKGSKKSSSTMSSLSYI